MKKKKSGKRIFAIVLLVVIGIGGFYFGYDIGRMDHDEERIRAELKIIFHRSTENTARSPHQTSGGCPENDTRIPQRFLFGNILYTPVPPEYPSSDTAYSVPFHSNTD